LDIGGGVGIIQHELLPAGVTTAVHIDAATAYLDAAKEEAKRRG
jgi:magnesium-protoporphyrin O-methyltransferase